MMLQCHLKHNVRINYRPARASLADPPLCNDRTVPPQEQDPEFFMPQIGKKFKTASFSKGKLGKHYAYYHCLSSCGERNPAEDVHTLMLTVMEQIQLKGAVRDLSQMITKDLFSTNSTDLKTELQDLHKELRELNIKLQSVDDKFIEGHLSSEDYKRIKSRYGADQLRLQGRIKQLQVSGVDFDKDLNAGLLKLSNLKAEYQSAGADQKKQIVGSIFPEKVIFQKTYFRTPRLNFLIRLLGPPTLVLEDTEQDLVPSKTPSIPLGAPEGSRTPIIRTGI